MEEDKSKAPVTRQGAALARQAQLSSVIVAPPSPAAVVEGG